MRIALACLFLVSCSQPALQNNARFVEQLEELPLEQRQSEVDSMWTSLPSLPLIESDSLAVFLFRSDSSAVSVVGDFSEWNPDLFPMSRLEGTDLWHREMSFESDARLDYQFVVNKEHYTLDPANPEVMPGGFGSNSELSMPDYMQPEEIQPQPGGVGGELSEHSVSSTHLGSSRTVTIYTPPNYDASSDRVYGSLLLHDGSDYLRLGNMPAILDNLISSGRIEPLVAFFLDPADRMEEYARSSNEAFVDFVIEEFVPWAESTYNISREPGRTAVTGISLGGNISAQLCNEHPEVFGLCAPLSTAFGVDRGALLSRIADSGESTVKYYVEWGTYEPPIARYAPDFIAALENNGNELLWNEWHEGHSWGMWRAHQDIILEYFFPANPR